MQGSACLLVSELRWSHPGETGDDVDQQEAGKESILKEGLRAAEARQTCGPGAKPVWLNCRQKGHAL